MRHAKAKLETSNRPFRHLRRISQVLLTEVQPGPRRADLFSINHKRAILMLNGNYDAILGPVIDDMMEVPWPTSFPTKARQSS
jgi:hypothetical protein